MSVQRKGVPAVAPRFHQDGSTPVPGSGPAWLDTILKGDCVAALERLPVGLVVGAPGGLED